MGRFWRWLSVFVGQDVKDAADAAFWRDKYDRLATKYRALQSLRGAGPPGYANCDTPWQYRFSELEKDYKIMLRETVDAITENAKLRHRVEVLTAQLQEYGASPRRYMGTAYMGPG
jgi:hypothetical protein